MDTTHFHTHNTSHPRAVNQKGLTLIEALFWIGGFGIVVAGVVAAAAGLFTGLDSGNLDRTFSSMKSEIENNLYAGEASYGTDPMLELLNNAGVLPDNWDVSSNPASIPGGLFARVDGNGPLYSISIAPLDQGVCTQLVSGLDSHGWNVVNVNPGTTEPTDPGFSATDAGTSNITGAGTDGLRVTSITPAQAESACGDGNAEVVVGGGR